MKRGYVYIITNKTRSTFYIGVTSDIVTRIYHHKQGIGGKFASRYKAYYLIYYEMHDSIVEAIRREKQLKKWERAWKERLVRSVNPEMRDLWDEIITR